MAETSITVSEKFSQLLELINKDNEPEFASLSRSGFDPNEVDDHGMSLLQHAAFKGRSKIVTLLLKHGCDVNDTKHQHQYSTLHFGALSGDVITVRELLNAGAKTEVENSVKRTPAQMAAFVGQSHVASYINSFFSPKVLLHYTKSDVGDNLRIDQKMAHSLHQIVSNYNINPVRLVMLLQGNTTVLDNLILCKNVLECERDKQFKKDNNESLSVRFHFIAQLFSKLHEVMEKEKEVLSKSGDTENIEEIHNNACENMKKWLLKTNKSGTVDENLERFIRIGLKEYPFTQNVVLQQAVKTLASANEEEKTITAFSVYSQLLTGSQSSMLMPESFCVTCDERLKSHLRCSRCKQVQYCDKKCQALHWPSHKKVCCKS